MIFVEKFPELLNVPGHVTPENIGWIYGNVKSMLVSEKWFLPVSMLYLAGTMIFFLWRAVHFK